MDLTTFQAAVATKVGNCNETVLDRVVDHYAELEANRRVPMIIQGLAKADEVKKSLGKFKAESTYNDNGDVVSTFWTRGTFEAKKKAEENMKKWEEALGLAIAESNYAPLEKLIKSGGQSNDQKKPDQEESE